MMQLTSHDSLPDCYTRFTSLEDFLHYYFIGVGIPVHQQDLEAFAWCSISSESTQMVQRYLLTHKLKGTQEWRG